MRNVERERSPPPPQMTAAARNVLPSNQISSDPFKINGFLTHTRSSQEIFGIIQNNINHFDKVNTATAFNKLGHAFEHERRTITGCSPLEKKILADLQSKAYNYLDRAYDSIDTAKPLKQVQVPQPFEIRHFANAQERFARFRASNGCGTCTCFNGLVVSIESYALTR